MLIVWHFRLEIEAKQVANSETHPSFSLYQRKSYLWTLFDLDIA